MGFINVFQPKNNPYHPDIQLFLFLIPFISAFNYYLTYSNIQFNGFLLLTFGIDTIQGYLAVAAVRQLIMYLDKKLPFDSGQIRRIIFQILSTTFLGLLVISFLTEAVSLIARGKMVPLSFYTVDLFIIGIWFFVVNGIYILLHFYHQWKTTEIRILENNKLLNEGLMVHSGKNQIRLPFEELTGFTVDGDYAVAHHQDGKKYYLDQSLNALEPTLPTSLFFRANRQFILNRRYIKQFKKTEYGKLIVELSSTGHFPDNIVISRLKSPIFKKWFLVK